MMGGSRGQGSKLGLQVDLASWKWDAPSSLEPEATFAFHTVSEAVQPETVGWFVEASIVDGLLVRRAAYHAVSGRRFNCLT